jgi:hypothetical protein
MQGAVKYLGSLTAIALPGEITSFNVNQRYMFRLLIILCTSLSMTDFDVPASVVLLLVYIAVSEWLDWSFPDEEGEKLEIAKDKLSRQAPNNAPWQYQAVGSMIQN